MPNGFVDGFAPSQPFLSRAGFFSWGKSVGYDDSTIDLEWIYYRSSSFFENDVYRVRIDKSWLSSHSGRTEGESESRPKMINQIESFLLVISMKSGGVIDDWRDVQAIKNKFAGHLFEAVDLFPSSRRRYCFPDGGNCVPLWCFLDSSGRAIRLPFGLPDRIISGVTLLPFCDQRPFGDRLPSL
jgi:hypothetical protein